MSFFVDERPVAVSDEAGNTVWVLPKMGLGTIASVHADFNKIGDSLSAWRLALLRHNIVRWEGPDFVGEDGKPVACSHANIDRLDVDLPLVTAVREKIVALNLRAGEEDGGEGGPDPLPAADAT